MTAVVAAVLCGAATLLLRQRTVAIGSGNSVLWRVVPVLAFCGVLALVGRHLVPVLVIAGGLAGLHQVRRRAHASAVAVEVAAAVRESCEALAGELVAGVTVGQALEVAAEVWTPLEVAVRADQVGGSVPDALRGLVRQHPGAGDLRQVAAAWQLSQRSGAALGGALDAVAADLVDQQATRALVRTELASARATARLIAGLPVLTLLISSGTGDPVGFLLGTAPGVVCLGMGLSLALFGLGWIERIAAGVEQAI